MIIGPESTGKSEMCRYLAQHYKAVWVEEYARAYLENLQRPYTEGDLEEIAKGQLALEKKRASESNDLLFIDTNLEVIKVWSENSFGDCSHFILSEIARQEYDYYLLMDIDLPWSEDPLREHPLPEQRRYFFNIYKDIVAYSDIPFSLVSGVGSDRFDNGRKAVEHYLKNNK